MTLLNLNKKLSSFSLGKVILCLKSLCYNGFRLFYKECPMSPAKYKQGKIKTQSM